MQEKAGKRVSRVLKEARLWGPVAGLFILDQLSKELAFRLVGPGERRVLIEGLLRITPRVNPGLMWSILRGLPNVVFIVPTIGVVALLLYYHYKPGAGEAQARWTVAALALVMGGALGNLLDRFIAEGVRDFIDIFIPLIDYDYPVFNLADAYIVAGVAIYFIAGFKKGKKA